ncbi:MAG: hypothetical protein LBV54_05640 [Puniceicoccales bacterium]|jgi:hypothetical protein|nr:hypothetical protein [Puniceicoccales bacterium]
MSAPTVLAISALIIVAPALCAGTDTGIPPLQQRMDVPNLDPTAAPRRAGAHPFANLSVAGDYVFGLGSDVRGQKGWGGSLSLLILPGRTENHRNWQFQFGAELYGFSTTGTRGYYRESVDAGVLYANVGGSYCIGEHLEIGLLIGGGVGGSYGETKDRGHTERKGNWDYACQVKPSITVHLTDSVSLFAAYRFSYISPMYRTDLIGYKSVDMLHQSVEFGVTWRF